MRSHKMILIQASLSRRVSPVSGTNTLRWFAYVYFLRRSSDRKYMVGHVSYALSSLNSF